VQCRVLSKDRRAPEARLEGKLGRARTEKNQGEQTRDETGNQRRLERLRGLCRRRQPDDQRGQRQHDGKRVTRRRSGTGMGRDPAAGEKPSRRRGRRPWHEDRETGPRECQEEVIGHGKHDRGQKQSARHRSVQSPSDRNGREKKDREQVTAPERPAPMPIRVGREEDQDQDQRARDEETVGAVLARSPPSKEARTRPDQERREEQDSPRWMKEKVPQNGGVRPVKTKKALSRQGRGCRVRLARVGGGGRPDQTNILVRQQK